MFMFGTTTFMFILGIITLALQTTLGFQQMQLLLNPDASGVWSPYRTNVVIAVEASITRLMVSPQCCLLPSPFSSSYHHLPLVENGS
jgi:hypothetical protein